MKNTIKLMCAASVALLAASCTDLDAPVESQYTEYPTSQIAQEAKLSDVYFQLRGVLGRRFMEAQALASDEWTPVCFDGNDYWDSGTYAYTAMHNNSADDASIGWYEDVASGITKANQAIVDMGGTQNKATAGARTLRAFFHFVLMDNYGDVPVIDTLGTDTTVYQRQPRAKVAQFIADELEACIPQLTDSVNANTYGKPTRYMAEALLAKLYINWPVYTADAVENYDASTYKEVESLTGSDLPGKLERVIELCDDIINSKKFDLTGGAAGHSCGNAYRAKFLPDNGSQIKDFIYAMPYDAVNQTGMQYGRPRTWRKANTDVSYYGTTLSKSCGGNFAITPEMSDKLMALKGDIRQEHVLAGTIMLFDAATYKITQTPWTYKDGNVTLTKDITLQADQPLEKISVSNDQTGWSQGYRSVKWFVKDEDFKNDRNQGNDVPIFRLADIKLIKAEALLRQKDGGNATADQLVNDIRDYVGLSNNHVSGITLTQLLDERARELFDENWRRNDMIRFGTYESDYGFHKRSNSNANFDKKHRIFPIPTTVINKNGWKQNAGY